MKKFFAILPCAMAVSTMATPHKGFNVFMAAGPAISRMKIKGTLDLGAAPADQVPFAYKNTPFGFGAGMLGGGYTFGFSNDMFLSFSGAATYSSLVTSKQFDVGENETPAEQIKLVQFNQGQNLAGVLALRVGYAWDKWEVSLGCSVAFTPFWLETFEPFDPEYANPPDTVTHKLMHTKKTLWGVGPSAKIAYKMTSDVQVFLETSRIFYQQKLDVPQMSGSSSSGTDNAYAFNAGGTSAVQTAAVMLGVQVAV